MSKEINEQVYAEGFNMGYWLFSYEPEVAKSFIDNEVVIYDDYSEGFANGLQQAQHEKTLGEFEQLRDHTNERDNSMDR